MTLGVSPTVSSCTDPVVSAICWFLALNSRRKLPALRIESSFIMFVHTKHLPQPDLQRRFGRALTASVQPIFKVLDLHNMRNLGMPDLHGNGGQSSSDVPDPVMTAQRGESLGDSFVEGFCRHVERVRGLVQIVDNDGTGFKRHDGKFIIFAICSLSHLTDVPGRRSEAGPQAGASLDLLSFRDSGAQGLYDPHTDRLTCLAPPQRPCLLHCRRDIAADRELPPYYVPLRRQMGSAPY